MVCIVQHAGCLPAAGCAGAAAAQRWHKKDVSDIAVLSSYSLHWSSPTCRLLDTDTYLYRDPYKYLTVPPFKDIPWMSLQDGGNIVNGGAPLPSFSGAMLRLPRVHPSVRSCLCPAAAQAAPPTSTMLLQGAPPPGPSPACVST